MSGFWTNLQNKSPQTRWIIAIVLTAVIMSFVVYFWYVSFKNLLSGSFEVAQENSSSNVKNGGIQESFLTSLKGLLSDLKIDTSRWREIGASLPSFSEMIKKISELTN